MQRRDVATLVPAFVKGMAVHFQANDHKPGWQRDSVESLLAQVTASRKKLAVSVHGKESVAEACRGRAGQWRLPHLGGTVTLATIPCHQVEESRDPDA